MSARAHTGVRGRWVRPFLAQYWRALLVALALTLLTFAFDVGLMATAGYLISASAAVETVLLLEIPLILVRVFGVGKPVLGYLERLASHDWVLRMTSSMRERLFAILERTAMRPQEKRRSGEVLGLLSDDIEHMQDLYVRVVLPTLAAWLLAVAAVAVAGLLCPWAALAMAAALLVVVVLAPLVSTLAEAARQRRRKALRDELYDTLTDNVLGVGDWVCAGRGEEFCARHARTQAEVARLQRTSDAHARMRDVLVQTVFALVVVMLLVAATQAFRGGDVNWIAAFALGFFPLIESFAPVPQAAVDALSHAQALAHLDSLPGEEAHGAEQPARVAHASGSRSRSGAPQPDARAGERGAAPSPAPTPQAPYDIELADAHFSHDGESRAVLDGIDLTIPAGTRLAVLGRSGAGKSTLLSLLRGDARPSAGTVTLGGVACHELRDEMHRYIGVISQDSYLFNASLLENVRLGAPHANEQRVMDALRAVGLAERVERLPQGLTTTLSEQAGEFSGGEARRIAIARVLLADTPVVMLDEPMVGLDPITERELLDTLLETLAGKTIVMVTHHLQGISRFDDVAFLEHGRLALHGSPERLETTSTRYRELLALERGA